MSLIAEFHGGGPQDGGQMYVRTFIPEIVLPIKHHRAGLDDVEVQVEEYVYRLVHVDTVRGVGSYVYEPKAATPT